MARRIRKLRRAPVFLAAMLASLCLCASAAADVTVGEVAPPNPETFCNLGPTDTIQIGTAGGDSYAMPEAGVLTSWSTSAGAGENQFLSLNVYRPVSGGIYSIVGHDGPRALTPSALNTFPIDIPVEAGDVLGLNDHQAPTAPDACAFFTGAAGDVEGGLFGEAPPGSQLNFEPENTEPDVRVNVSANLQPLVANIPPVTPTVPTASGPPASGGPTAGPPASGPPAPTPKCVVPRLGAKKLGAAKVALKKADCRLGRVAKLNGATTKSGVVASQNPQSGKTLAAGTKVAVKLVPPAR